MSTQKRLIASLPALPAAGAVFLLAQVLRAAHRSDLPSFPNQDPSGVFGDSSLPPLRVVALGDSSITAPGVTRLDNVWVRRVVRGWSDCYHVQLTALAVGGSKAHDVIEGQLDEAVRLRPDIAVVSVGSNDALRGVSAARFAQRLHHILDRLEAVAAGVVLVGMGDLGAIPRLPAALRPYVSWRGRKFDDVCTQVAAVHPRTLKVFTRGRMSTAFWEDRSLFADDQFHAGDGGHGVFADEAGPTLEASLAAVEARRAETDRLHAGSARP